MVTAVGSQYTPFTLDNMGRFLCNTLDEAIDSTNELVAGKMRTFDVIVVGGGTFGCVMAESLFVRDPTRSRRILVLEQGPFVLAEHVQNTPFLGGVPDARVPWVTDPTVAPAINFTGLTHAIGGRSLHWGGWSPEPLHDPANDEMGGWPASVVNELQSEYFPSAAAEIGVSSTNDFIHGPLHQALRKQVRDGLQGAAAPSGLILGGLPNHPVIREYLRLHPGETLADITDDQLREWLTLPATDTTPRAELLEMLKLEAPLAVQSITEPGAFPFNKFSGIPLAIQAARTASVEADGTGPAADARKRVMIVPGWHAQELITETQPDNWVRVVGVRLTNDSGATREVFLAPPRSDGTQGVVIVALGTIESTRLALTTFQSSLAGRAAQRMGENLIAHLRTNLTIRIPQTALTHLPPQAMRSLQVSALFVKGKATIDGTNRYFHLQITASGLTDLGNNSEANLFKKVPDVDQFRVMTEANKTTVVITLRGIGEMTPMNPDSQAGLATTPRDVDYGRPKAYANIGNARADAGGSPETQADRKLWDAMDDFADHVAVIFANGEPFEILTGTTPGLTPPDMIIPVPAGATAADVRNLRMKDGKLLRNRLRDALGTTHHEAGTLRMSVAPADGVTNEYGRVHDTTNCYVAGPALFPSSGSPNPMLSSVALIRRTADLLSKSVLPKPAPVAADPGFRLLFDGTAISFNRWSRVSPGAANGFALVEGEIVTYGNGDLGLLYYAAEAFANFTLRVEFKVFDPGANSGIFVRFRDPLRDLPQAILDRIRNEANQFSPDQLTDWQHYAGIGTRANRAWSAVHSGFEVQIDDVGAGDPRRGYYGTPEPPGLRKNRTGAIYKIPAGDPIPNTGLFDAAWQTYTASPPLEVGTWHQFTIGVNGNNYTVDLKNLRTGATTRTSTFTNTDGVRGVAKESNRPIGFIGLQAHAGSPVAFRRIQVK